MGSKPFSFSKEDGEKILKGALIAIWAAILTYVSQIIAHTDFGSWTPVITAAWGIILNSGKRYILDNSKKDDTQLTP